MSDEVEVVIIATGFNHQNNGITPEAQQSALRQASLLSRKIDGVYQTRNDQTYPTPSYTAQPQNGGYGYEPIYPQQPIQPVEPVQSQAQAPIQPIPAFEPDDPIPELPQTNPAENVDRKHRPRFVDYFMKKKSNDKE
jgi:hypothetical protein